jgi:hypothetical protein
MTFSHEPYEARPFFSQIPAFVLTRPAPAGKLDVVGHETERGPAVDCYLSPVHALIEATYRMLVGESCDITPAGLVGREAFRTADGLGLVANVHLAWPARDRRIMVMPDMRLTTVSQLMCHRSTTGTPLNAFEVDEIILGRVNQLYERAGLFAWCETHRDAFTAERGRLTRTVMRAVGTMQTTQITAEDLSQCQEVALFDPEFGQWHFVPVDGLVR